MNSIDLPHYIANNIILCFSNLVKTFYQRDRDAASDGERVSFSAATSAQH